MNNLQQVFSKFSNKNKEVLICLDDTFCFARSPETKPKNCISITSIMDKEDVYECLKEEGSAIINFKLTNKGVNKNSNINKILNSFVSSLVEFNFDPFIVTLFSTEDIGFVNEESDYDSMDYDDNKEEDEDEEDEDEGEEDGDEEDEGEEEGEDNGEEDNGEVEDGEVEDGEVKDGEVEDGEEDNGEVEVGEEENEDNEIVENGDEEEENGDEEEDKCNDSNIVNINTEDDSIDGDTEDVETSSDEEDEDDPVKKEISIIKNELENMDKFKKNDFISFLARLNIKNINGKNTRHCNKKELYNFLVEKLEN